MKTSLSIIRPFIGEVSSPRQFVWRLVVIEVGLFVFAFGNCLNIQANLGYAPWNVLSQGVALHTPLTIGRATVVTGLALILFSLLLNVKPGLGTLLNMFFIGYFTDLILDWRVIPDATQWGIVAQITLTTLGVLVTGIGSGLYIKAALGAGPRDSFMLALTRRTGWRVSIARTVTEWSAALVGVALGGPIGLGTLIFAFGLGPSVELGFRLFRVSDPRKVTLVQPKDGEEGE